MRQKCAAVEIANNRFLHVRRLKAQQSSDESIGSERCGKQREGKVKRDSNHIFEAERRFEQ
jgi:hypothetical protein